MNWRWGRLLFSTCVFAASLQWLTACTVDDGSDSNASKLTWDNWTAVALTPFRSENQKSFENVMRTFTSEELARALKIVAQTLVSRDPTANELAQAAKGVDAYKEVIESYFATPSFQTTHLNYYRAFFEMAGTANGIDYDEPANLAVYIAVNDLPFTEILRATYCVKNENGELKKKPCSSFNNNESLAQSQGAGVVTTQAFLQKWSSSFNFRRVSKAFKFFACSEYPDPTDPGMTEKEISDSVKNFSCTDCEPACYSCHRTLNPRATLFYVFDRSGKYNPAIADASQAQDPNVANLTDTNTVSFRRDLIKENVQIRYHGRPVKSVKEYAYWLSENKSFRDCFAQRMVNLLLGRGPYEPMPPEFQNVRDDVKANGFSTQKVLLQIATHPAFVRGMEAK